MKQTGPSCPAGETYKGLKEMNVIRSHLMASGILFLCLLWFCFLPREVELTSDAQTLRDGILSTGAMFIPFLLGGVVVVLIFFVNGNGGLMSRLAHAQNTLGLVPVAFFCAVGAFLQYALLRLGYFPQPNSPDPSRIGVSALLFGAAWIGIYTLLTLLFIIGLRMGGVRRSRPWAIGSNLFFAACWAALVFFLVVDPLAFLSWLAD